MSKPASVYHLDTSVLISIFTSFNKDLQKIGRQLCYRIKEHNSKVKVSLLVIGEFLAKCIEKGNSEEVQNAIHALRQFHRDLGDRIEFGYNPRLWDEYKDFPQILERLLKADEYLRPPSRSFNCCYRYFR